MTFEEICKKVFEINPELKDKSQIIDGDACKIEFNKYLNLYFDDDSIVINNNWHTHWGLLKVENLFFDIIKGNIIFVEDKRRFSWKLLLYLFKEDYRLNFINKEKFNKKKYKLLKNKHLKIYTTKEIIKE